MADCYLQVCTYPQKRGHGGPGMHGEVEESCDEAAIDQRDSYPREVQESGYEDAASEGGMCWSSGRLCSMS